MMHGILKAHPTVRALYLVYREAAQLTRVDVVGTEVRSDGVAHHVQLHRPLEDDAAETIVVVIQRTLNGCQDSFGNVRGVVFRAEVAHVEAQRLFDKFAAALAVILCEPAIHTLDGAGAKP